MPDLSTWQIDYVYPNDPKKAAIAESPTPKPAFLPNTFSSAPPRRVILTFTRPVWRADIENVDGRRVEEWSDGSNQVVMPDGTRSASLVPIDGEGIPMVPNYGAAGFPDMEWVSPSTYQGVQKIGSYQCYVFTKADATVYVDADSRFPVRWQRKGEIRGFSQLAPPDNKLTMPPEVSQISQQVKKDMYRILHPLGR